MRLVKGGRDGGRVVGGAIVQTRDRRSSTLKRAAATEKRENM